MFALEFIRLSGETVLLIVGGTFTQSCLINDTVHCISVEDKYY